MMLLRLLFPVGLIALGSVSALAHDPHRPFLDDWYSSLKRPHPAPTGFTSCCSKTDCHPTEAELRGQEWWARIGARRLDGDWNLTDWVKIPKDTVLQHQSNQAGEAVICHSLSWGMGGKPDPSTTTVWCFVPPTES